MMTRSLYAIMLRILTTILAHTFGPVTSHTFSSIVTYTFGPVTSHTIGSIMTYTFASWVSRSIALGVLTLATKWSIPFGLLVPLTAAP